MEEIKYVCVPLFDIVCAYKDKSEELHLLVEGNT